MTKPSEGDTVCCKLNDGFITYNYQDKYEIIESFDVIAIVPYGYLIKIPNRIFLKNSFEITVPKAKEYDISNKFVGTTAHFVADSHVLSIKFKKDGEFCDRCGDFFHMAQKNPDGSFKCYLCRNYRFR